MKYYAIAFLGGVLACGLVAYNFGFFENEVVYNNEEQVVIDNTPEWAVDEEAKAAAEAVVKRKELEQKLEEKQSEASQLTETYQESKAVVDAEIEELEKELGTYWKSKANIKALIRETFPEDPVTAVTVAELESELRMVQSDYVYTATNVPAGYKVGDREESYCIFQIHKPAHHATAERLGLADYATNVESCVKMAKVIKDKSGWSPWTVYQTILAMR